jgi:ATP-dependent RNA helicase RhlE
MPRTTDDYIHRIGRTGRVNNNGDALTFVTSSDRAMVSSIERMLNTKIERLTLENFDYGQSAPVKTDSRRRFREVRRPYARKRISAVTGKR